jgi:hypothetical protein
VRRKVSNHGIAKDAPSICEQVITIRRCCSYFLECFPKIN